MLDEPVGVLSGVVPSRKMHSWRVTGAFYPRVIPVGLVARENVFGAAARFRAFLKASLDNAFALFHGLLGAGELGDFRSVVGVLIVKVVVDDDGVGAGRNVGQVIVLRLFCVLRGDRPAAALVYAIQ